MIKPVLVVMVVGAGLGLMLPTSTPDAQPVAAAATGTPPAEVRLERRSNGHFYVHGEVNGQLARFMVDTGASFVALTMRDAERLGVSYDPAQFEVVASGASGPVRGQRVTFDKIVVEGREVRQVEGAVIEGLEISLLGQSFLSQVGSIQMAGDTMIIQ